MRSIGPQRFAEETGQGLDQRDFAIKIGLFLCMELEGNAADRSDAFQHRERVPGVFGVLQAGNHRLCGTNLFGELGLSDDEIDSYIASGALVSASIPAAVTNQTGEAFDLSEMDHEGFVAATRR